MLNNYESLIGRIRLKFDHYAHIMLQVCVSFIDVMWTPLVLTQFLALLPP